MRSSLLLAAALLLWGCGDATLRGSERPADEPPPPGDEAPTDPNETPHDPGDPEDPETPPREMPGDRLPGFAPAPATLHRLTRAQYVASTRALMGDVVVPDDLEVDTPLHGFTTIGAAELTIGPRAAEQFEAAALSVAEQAIARREGFTGCDAAEEGCRRAFLARFGRQAWRRPIDGAELDELVALSTEVGGLLRDPWRGLELTVAGVLQSPDFLFRVEVGEPDPDDPGRRRYTAYEMASRLSFLLWGTTPDDALLAAAASGALVTDAGIRAAAERLIDAPEARPALRRFFAEYFVLDRLDSLTKDADAFPQMSPSLGASMRDEVLTVLDALVFEDDTDVRRLLTTRDTFVNDELAALYGLPAVDGGGMQPTRLPADNPRGGLLGTGAFLALNAHFSTTSPTLRGKYVQNILLCVDIPPPPPGVVADLAEEGGDVPRTTREKLARHRDDPACAGCHVLMDPLGLGLERFDAIGAYRTTENGLPVDARSELNGAPFEGPRALGELLRGDPRVADCITRRAYRYATGHLEARSEEVSVRAIRDTFAASGHRVRAMLLALVTSDGFRYAAEGEP